MEVDLETGVFTKSVFIKVEVFWNVVEQQLSVKLQSSCVSRVTVRFFFYFYR